MLETRSTEPEIMDDLLISGGVVDQTLRELDLINRKLGGNEISLRNFRQILKSHDVRSVADLGCGGADILLAMAKIARKQDKPVQFIGVDANPHIIDYARENTENWPEIQLEVANIFNPAFQQKQFDIIHCCLFLHHFTDDQLVELFRSFRKQARVAILVNDLHRHWLAYHSISWITKLFSRSYMVRNDARISVARGFKKQELIDIMRRSGIQNFQLRWRWAFRWELLIKND